MATVTAQPSARAPEADVHAWRAVARRALRDSRARTLGFGYLFLGVAFIQPVAYRRTYPTLADRLSFARSFGANKAVVLFYGKAYDLLTVGGYTAWRAGGVLAIFAAVFGLLAAVRALRAEEESGRAELVLAGVLGRRSTFLAAMAAIGAGAAVLWVAEWVGLVLGRLPAASSAYLALATVSVVGVFVGVGALVSQIAPTRRSALEAGGGIVALFFVLRVVADTSSGLGWLRWVTPLGWAEELRPFTGPEPAVLLLPLAATVLSLIVSERISLRRDIGSGLLTVHDLGRSRVGLLSSPAAQGLREERASLIVWACGIGAFAFIVGVISKSISSGISKQLERELSKLGAASVVTPKGYIGFAFIFFVLAVSLFGVSQIAAARREEADGRLETLLALPVGRVRWLGGRLLIAAGAAMGLSLIAGVLAWAGAASQDISLSFGLMLEAGLNCLPVALLFLGIAVLAYAGLPRAAVGISYGLVAVAFLWQLFGSLLGAPRLLVHLTPFAHVGLVPAQAFRGGPAALMLAGGVLASAIALGLFRRRDLTEA